MLIPGGHDLEDELVFCFKLAANVVRGGVWQFVVVVENLGFTALLTSQVISVAFYSEHEKSTNFAQRF